MPRTRKRKPGPGPAVTTSQVFGPTDHAAEGLVPTDSPNVWFNAKPWKGKSKRRGRPVDLLYALRSGNHRKNPNLEIVTDRLMIETDPLSYALPFAEAVAEQIDANIRAGKNPSGRASKPLDPEWAKRRGSSGPRGLRTGKTLSTLRVEVKEAQGFSRGAVTVKMDQPYGNGQFSSTFQGSRFSYSPRDPIIAAALDELVDIILAPDDGGE
jgi:hypothetical protein